MARLKFVAKISKMGDNKIIWIPAEHHDEITAKFGKKQVRVTIDDEI